MRNVKAEVSFFTSHVCREIQHNIIKYNNSFNWGVFQIFALGVSLTGGETPPTAAAPVGVTTNRRKFEIRPFNPKAVA